MKKSCKRKHYKLLNPITHALQGAAFLQDAQLVTLRLRELSAIKSFVDGVATIQEWQDVNALQGLCEIMALKGCGPEALSVTSEAQEILKKLALGYDGKQMKVSENEGKVFYDLYIFHDLQRTSVCRSEYEKYIELAVNHTRSKSNLIEEIA